jgi:hypothetical protein
MTRPARTTAAIAIVAAALALTACSTLFGPPRDADGRVTETTEVGSTTLLVGDCFSFVEGTNLSKSSVTPCSEPHTHIVIGLGDLTTKKIDEAGGLQNAVSASCAEVFAIFKEAAAEGTKPEQEFIVSTSVEDDVETTHYKCVATDSAASTNS